MPVIVDEVVISVDVTNEASGGASRPPSAQGGAAAAGGASLSERQALVAECVERVLEVLARKAEP